jgi:hypothetical protein
MLELMRARIASVACALAVVAGASWATTPTAEPGDSLICIPPYGTFRAGNWPSGCWRPYAKTSPWNRPIGAKPHHDPESRQVIRRLRSWGAPDSFAAGEAGTRDDFNHPTYYSLGTDPQFRLHCYWRKFSERCSIEGKLIRVPDAARPAAGRDGHMTIVDQRSGWEYDLYHVSRKPKGGGTLWFRWGGRTRIDRDGLGSDATAARFGNLAGIIRAPELEDGVINHALFMVVRCDSGVFRYPAFKTGRACAELGKSNLHAPPMGARFQLNMSFARIDSLKVPTWRKTIFKAMSRYGLYVGDTGDGAWGVEPESGSTYTSFGHEDPLVTFARRHGIPERDGRYWFNISNGVNWLKYLRLLAPCESLGSC